MALENADGLANEMGALALHDDLRMDVDNMSYEELLALGERIGNVSTGLTGRFITSKLQKGKFYSKTLAGRQAKDGELKCSICQEEYEDGEELGRVNCGHRYHVKCIRRWLKRKNLCPICKASAL